MADFKRSRWPWDVHEPQVKHQGFLLKSGRYFGERTAKKRHCALVVDLGGAFLLLGGDGDEEIGSLAQLQDAVDTRSARRRTCVDLLVGCAIDERGDDRFGFALRCPGRKYVFAAMGLEGKKRWVTRLKNAVATGMETSARPDVLVHTHRALEQHRKGNAHHVATSFARWQDSGDVATDELIELVESPPPVPRQDSDDARALRDTQREHEMASPFYSLRTTKESSARVNDPESPTGSEMFDKDMEEYDDSDCGEKAGPTSVSWDSPSKDVVRGFSPVGSSGGGESGGGSAGGRLPSMSGGGGGVGRGGSRGGAGEWGSPLGGRQLDYGGGSLRARAAAAAAAAARELAPVGPGGRNR